jgi:hypothetical protein
MFFSPFYALFVLLLCAGGGLAFASRQPGGATEYLRGPGRAYLIRAVLIAAVFFAMNVYYRARVGI